MRIAALAGRHAANGGLTRYPLGLNENPYGPLPSVHEKLAGGLAVLNRYPEFLPQRLPAMIAAHAGFDPGQVVVGNGATGVALQVLHAVAKPGDRIVFGLPTFDGYPIMAEIAGLRPVPIPLDGSGGQHLDRMLSAVKHRTRVLVLCRPHNPTGTVVPRDELVAFLDAVPRDIVVVLDEAYVEFMAPGHRVDARVLVDCYPNLFVLRTFSKAYGLAGLRIGYGLAGLPLAAEVRRLQLPFGMSALAEQAVAASFQADAELRARVQTIVRHRDWLAGAIAELRWHVPVSHANFVFVDGAEEVVRPALERAGVQAKYYPGGGVRVTVGDEEANAAVLAAFSAARV